MLPRLLLPLEPHLAHPAPQVKRARVGVVVPRLQLRCQFLGGVEDEAFGDRERRLAEAEVGDLRGRGQEGEIVVYA